MSFFFYEPPQDFPPRRFAPVVAAAVPATQAAGNAGKYPAGEHFEDPFRLAEPRRFAPIAIAAAPASLAFSGADRFPALEHFDDPFRVTEPRRFSRIAAAVVVYPGLSRARSLPDASVWDDAADVSQRRRFAPLAAPVPIYFGSARRARDSATLQAAGVFDDAQPDYRKISFQLSYTAPAVTLVPQPVYLVSVDVRLAAVPAGGRLAALPSPARRGSPTK